MFKPDFGRRSSFGDAGWADHTVPDVQGHLRVHADILSISGVRRHRQADQLTLAFKHGVATLDGGSTMQAGLTIRRLTFRDIFLATTIPLWARIVAIEVFLLTPAGAQACQVLFPTPTDSARFWQY